MGHHNGCRKCGCSNCDCNDRRGNEVCVGPATPDFLRFQTIKNRDAEIGPQTTQVDVCGDKDITLELPDCPRFGRAPIIINNIGNGTVTLVSDDADVVNDRIGPKRSALVTFAACDECGIWAVLLGSSIVAR